MKEHLKVAKRLALQGAIPFIFAFIYALWDYHSTTNEFQTTTGFLKSLGLAFFLIMWFVGQWFRASKQISDSEQLSSIQSDVAAIREAVGQSHETPQNLSVLQAVRDPVARALLMEAESAMNANLMHSALLTAGVALEHSVRNFAEGKLLDTKKLPVYKLLTLFQEYLNPSIVKELKNLWKARNALAHMRDEDLIEPVHARKLFDSFVWAIRLLSNPE